MAGIGAAAADTLYGVMTGFSVNFVIALLVRAIFWIRLFGGIPLIGIGVAYLLRPPRGTAPDVGVSLEPDESDDGALVPRGPGGAPDGRRAGRKRASVERRKLHAV